MGRDYSYPINKIFSVDPTVLLLEKNNESKKKGIKWTEEIKFGEDGDDEKYGQKAQGISGPKKYPKTERDTQFKDKKHEFGI